MRIKDVPLSEDCRKALEGVGLSSVQEVNQQDNTSLLPMLGKRCLVEVRNAIVRMRLDEQR